jgi:hypothetical protein
MFTPSEFHATLAGNSHMRALKTHYYAANSHMGLKEDKCIKAEERVKIRKTQGSRAAS